MNQSIAPAGAPAASAWRLRIALLFFVVGVLGPVLGLLIRWLNVPEGPFWDKLSALFRYRTKVAFPDDAASLGRHLP